MNSREYTVCDIQACVEKLRDLYAGSLLRLLLLNHLMMLKKNLELTPPRRLRYLSLTACLTRSVTESDIKIVSDIVGVLGVRVLILNHNQIGNTDIDDINFKTLDIFIHNKHQIEELILTSNHLSNFNEEEWGIFLQALSTSRVVNLDVSSNDLDNLRLSQLKAIIEKNPSPKCFLNQARGLTQLCSLFFAQNEQATLNVATPMLPQECLTEISNAKRLNSRRRFSPPLDTHELDISPIKRIGK